jgi:hypothetical protein
MCEALDIMPVVTTACGATDDKSETVEDMASFLEYLYGTNGTEFGRLRHADGHPKPYAQIHFEIGNEEHFDPAYLDRVVATVGAMEAKAKELQLPVLPTYLFDAQVSSSVFLNSTTVRLLTGFLKKMKPLGGRLLADFHTGTFGLSPVDKLPYLLVMKNLTKVAAAAGSGTEFRRLGGSRGFF